MMTTDSIRYVIAIQIGHWPSRRERKREKTIIAEAYIISKKCYILLLYIQIYIYIIHSFNHVIFASAREL